MAVHFPIVSWARKANIYEVNTRQYTIEGSFTAFQQHLPRLKDMGVDILWFMPVTPISIAQRQGTLGSYYACSSYTKINPEYGTLNDFKEMVRQAHALGMKVIIDWVANHTGCDHEWMKDHADFFMKDAAGNFTERNGWKDVYDLDYNNSIMRNAMIEAMQFWVKECDIDGFRCDMAHLVPLDFWKEARTHCDALKPLFWLAECEVVEYHCVFDVTYAWWWMHTTEKYAKQEASLNDVMNVLHAYSQYPEGAIKLFFTSNHDENSWNGTEYEKYGDAAMAWAVFACTWNGMPLMYSGQETENHKRLKFFDKDHIEWKQPLPLHDFYKTLLTLHKTKVIAEGETFILPTNNSNVLAYLRRKESEVVLVLLNFSAEEKVTINVVHEWLQGTFTNIFSGLSFQFTVTETFELEAFDYLVYSNVSKK
jgi:glycosidase